MQINVALMALYAMLTISGIALYRAINRNNQWRYNIVAAFGAFFFLYNGIGLSEKSVPGEKFVFYYALYFFAYIILFHFFSSFKISWGGRSNKAARAFFANKKICNTIIYFYIAAALLPLIVPEFRLHLLFSPPSINFLGVFSGGASTEDEAIKKLAGYMKYLLFAPFLLSLGSIKRNPVKLFVMLAFIGYIEYVSSAYLSRSSILMSVAVFIAYLLIEYPERRRIIIGFLMIGVPALGVAAAWFLSFRLGVDDQSIIELIGIMVEIESNFPREAGVALFNSGKNGDMLQYFIWIFTIPIPKVFFGKFIDYNINYEITYMLTGLSPGDLGFSVPLAGNLFSAIYALGDFFWVEPMICGALTGIAYKTASKHYYSKLLLAYILMTNAYVYNRAGVGGFAPAIYNTFIWLLVLWGPVLSFSYRNTSFALGIKNKI